MDAKALEINDAWFNGVLGTTYYAVGDLESARVACEGQSGDQANNHACLALVYYKLGRHADAEAMLADARGAWGDTGAVQYAEVYAQWGQTDHALDWLETAMRYHDPYLRVVKTDPLFDPLLKEPRFQAIERELKFP
jgi:tetratricopeptide (TPR) repeat protein